MDNYRDEVPKITIIGLGYVGLPLLTNFHNNGVICYGVDANPEKIEKLIRGISYIDDISSETVSSIDNREQIFYSKYELAIENSEISIIAVPTPVNDFGEPDLSYILSACNSIAQGLSQKTSDKPHIIVLESTTYPTTTEIMIRKEIEKYNLVMGRDFTLAYSPERISPGDGFEVHEIPKLLGTLDEETFERLSILYQKFGKITIIRASSPRTAELTKLFENIFRQVNIALVNELSILAERLGIDVYEVINLAKTKPFGFMPFYPGPGLGGHCIPVDPYYLSYIAKRYRIPTRFIELSNEINDYMTNHVIELAQLALNRVSKTLNGSKILIMGYAYKPEVSDYRNSPAIPIVEKLRILGSDLLISDNWVRDQHDFEHFVNFEDHLKDIDLVIVLTPHKYMNFDTLMSSLDVNQPILDTRGVYEPSKYRKNDIGLGRYIEEFSRFANDGTHE